MMLLMFVLWAIVFVGIFVRGRWTIPVSLVAIAWTLVMLRQHMTDPIPLNF